ncbi:MAG: methyltransferase family protein [Candidatus Asgardarchaeia archaeon]
MPKKNISHSIAHVIYIALYCVLMISAFIHYNSAGLTELLYVGWATLIFGVVLLSWSSRSRKKEHSWNDTNKETLVEDGIYAFVRHPEFLGHILIISALVIISQHWINLVIGTILIVLLCFAMIEEEKRNIEKFGDAYRNYMKRVPRINLLIGSWRLIHKKRNRERMN